MDLSALVAVEQAAERFLGRATTHVRANDAVAAECDLARALGMHRTPFADLMLGFARELPAKRNDLAPIEHRKG